MSEGTVFAPADSVVQALARSLRGKLVRPEDAEYETARRVYNAMIDKRPRLVVQCADIADVIAAVNFARQHELLVAIRGGAHNVAGFSTCDDGLVIDLSRLKGIRVNPMRRTVRVEGGCTWGDVDHATHAFGLATPGGLISTTGVAGLTLGGGIGYLTRACGLSADNLLSADVVTADGRFLTASADENPDLFWALRGGGGNFGVVTSFEFRLHPVNTVLAGPILWPIEKAGEAMRFYRDFMANGPDDLNAFFAFLVVPPGPPFPEHLHNHKACGVVVCHVGDMVKAEQAVKPLRQFGPPIFELVGPMPFPVVQQLFDSLLPPGLYQYWKADFVEDLTDAVIAAHLEHGPDVPNPSSAAHVYPVSGAAHRVGKHDTAFSYRDANYVHIMASVAQDPGEVPKHKEWVRRYWEALHPHSAGGSYVNFMMEEGEDRVAASYRDNYSRLAQIKKKYDPSNLFRLNQNIQPGR